MATKKTRAPQKEDSALDLLMASEQTRAPKKEETALDLLMHFTQAGSGEKDDLSFVQSVDDEVKKFLWSLNSNAQYEEDQYGGVKEQGFHPSGVAAGKCMRMGVYEYLGVAPDEDFLGIDPKTRLIFDNGHDVHDRWQTYFTLMSERPNSPIQLVGSWKCKGCGHVYSPDKEIPKPKKGTKCPVCGSTRIKYNEFRIRDKKLRITGKFDGKLLIFGKPHLLEIKSINTFSISRLVGPMEKHKKQVSLYQYCDNKDPVLFLYEDKNMQDVKWFLHHYNKKFIKDELAWLEEVNTYVTKQVLPDKDAGGKQCLKCAFRRRCKASADYATLLKELGSVAKPASKRAVKPKKPA